MIFLCILIGIIVAIVIDFVLQVTILNSISEIFISLCGIIWDFLCNITSPIRHPKVFFWLLKHNYNPFHLKISEICTFMTDKQFEEWIQFIKKEDVEWWKRQRNYYQLLNDEKGVSEDE